MKDDSTKHLIASLVTIMAVLAYTAGYFSAGFGWWWTVAGVLIIYGLIYKNLK